MISMGVRKGNTQLHDHLNAFLTVHKRDIDRLLASYGVPLLPIGMSARAQRTRGIR
jgi:hypothetical protein